ncbi:MAG: phage/plasmid primase, P4 family [Methanosarcina sp.]
MTTINTLPIIEARDYYTVKGIIVHPLCSPQDKTAGKDAGKAPIIAGYNKLVESAPAGDFTHARNIGFVCGEKSNITVIDIDFYFKGLWEFVFEDCDINPFLKQSHTENRWHWIFNFAKILEGKQYQELGFDILNRGTNCVAAPSIHKDGSKYQLSGDIEGRPEFPPGAAHRLEEVLKTHGELKEILKKCRPAWQGLWKAVFVNKNDELYHQPWVAFCGAGDNRTRHLGLCSELLANGAEQKHLILTAWLIFPDRYTREETLKNLKGINPRATWKNETIKADELLSRFYREPETSQARKNKPKTLGDTLKGLTPTPGVIAQTLQEVSPIWYDKSRNFWIWDAETLKYERVDDTEIMCQISNALDLTIYNSQMKQEIIEAMRQTGRKRRVQPTKKEWVQFQNLVYDLETGNTFEATPEYFFAAPIPHNLGTSEDTPIIDALFKSWLNDCPELLFEICAYCLYDGYPIQRLFAFVGPGSNGKGQFLKVLRSLLGAHNCTSTDLDRIEKGNFETAKLFHKKAAFVSETNYSTRSATAKLKQLCGGDLVSAEFKGKDPFDFENTAKIIIATNGLPESLDQSEGFFRRWCIARFLNKFKDGRDIVDEISETEYENLCLKCIRILKTTLSLGKLPHEPDEETRKDTYETLSNPVRTFLDGECCTDTEDFIPFWYLYARFEEYTKRMGHRKISKDEFSKILKAMGFKTSRLWFNTEEQQKYTNSSSGDRKQWSSVENLSFKSTSPDVVKAPCPMNLGMRPSPQGVLFSFGESGETENKVSPYKGVEVKSGFTAFTTSTLNQDAEAGGYLISATEAVSPNLVVSVEEAARRAIEGGL